jgi:hypothetical protein
VSWSRVHEPVAFQFAGLRGELAKPSRTDAELGAAASVAVGVVPVPELIAELIVEPWPLTSYICMMQPVGEPVMAAEMVRAEPLTALDV